ncbi:MAG: DNA translocase FtsK 4TM domain-containing protein [Patescibacteria group bacterium]
MSRSKKKKFQNKKLSEKLGTETEDSRLHPETKKSVWAIVFLGIAVIFILASFQNAGPVGNFIYKIFENLFGWGYYLLPTIFLIMAGVFLASERRKIYQITFIGAVLFVLSGLGLIDIISQNKGGIIGNIIGSLETPFGYTASIVIISTILVASLLITLNLPIKIRKLIKSEEKDEETEPLKVSGVNAKEEEVKIPEEKETIKEKVSAAIGLKPKQLKTENFRPKTDYIFPPLDLLKSSIEKPTSGDLRANANIIKRTLESFGIPVEMGEINIGPKVTRFTLKPAEGVKLSKILALNQDLALALAAHPIRIEAPIPGKSLVGIEVPNKAAALVRLGSLMAYPEFVDSGLLGFVLGRDVSGEPIFANIDKMPHLLIAGSTGSGKSISLHSLIISLLYKNSPETLKLALIDPKRVELSIYEGIPHLVAPVVTETKKAIGVFKWAIQEMERRYEMLLGAGCRDISAYNKKFPDESLPYLLLVIDELADLMTSYGREVEGSIVRLAQMARATGLHLIVSTQRPSVEIITGLIKANITSRIALQVPSQVDSRTILDTSGAEKLLGGGDMLFISSDFSKPKRIQGAYLSEEEINKVVNFIKENNKEIESEEILQFPVNNGENGENNHLAFDDYIKSDDEDELLDDALNIVKEAKKASASLLQRRLKIGYARAARLLDIMEAKGLIGPGDGAKPREVYIE